MTTRRRIPINGDPAAAEQTSAAAASASAPRPASSPASAPGPAGPDPVSAPAAPGTAGEPGSATPRETAAATPGAAPRGPATAAGAASPEATNAQGAAKDRIAGLEAEVEALRLERDGLADRELRLRAEFENYRRRASREALEARDRAQGQLISEMLPVLDNLERALDAAEHHDEGKVLGGVRMTRDMFIELLRRVGVEEIATAGLFDPNVHDAVVMQPSVEAEGTVTAVLERGYRQGDRVLRPARVAVSSGPAGGRE